MTDYDDLEQAARADVRQYIAVSNRQPATEAGRVIHDDWHADGPRGRTECGSMGCGMLGRILAIEAAAVREADALREALRDAAMSYHTVKEHSRKFSECDWASCRMWRAALSATEPVEGAK